MSSISTISSSNVTSLSSGNNNNIKLHRYNQLLPSSHTQVEQEGRLLLSSILEDLRTAYNLYQNDGHYDYILALRQIKRLVSIILCTNIYYSL